MKNSVSNGCRVTHTATADVVSGQGVAHGKLVGIATKDAVAGELVELVIVGSFIMPVKSGITIVAGDKVYLTADSEISNVATSNIECGFAEDGGTDSVTVILR